MGDLNLVSVETLPSGAIIKIEKDTVTGQTFNSTEEPQVHFYKIIGLGNDVFLCAKCHVRIEPPFKPDWKCGGDCKELGFKG